jgi:hypothetical protein
MPTADRYHGRRAERIENDHLRVTVLVEGGHIAEVLHKQSGVNPLWTPPWRSIEPSTYRRSADSVYGGGVDASLLCGIMGHNLCLDIFGGPSEEEDSSGLPVHGEASVVRYDVRGTDRELVMTAHLPLAQLRVERTLFLHDDAVRVEERVQNLSGTDRPVGWTEHVTLGPPFLRKGVTEFRASATKSKAYEKPFGAADYLKIGAEFDWPHAPCAAGGTADLRTFTDLPVSGAYTAHLMDPSRPEAFFVAFSPHDRLAFGYLWRRNDFPWMRIWEENLSRSQPPWNGQTITRGMEFGASPFPETRREMIERGRMFETPTWRWIPAASVVKVEYWIIVRTADRVPDSLERPAV